MSRIHPLHIAIVLILVVVLLGVKNAQAKKDLQEVKTEFAKVSKLSDELVKLQEIYDNKEKTMQSLQTILKHSSLKNSAIEQKVVANKISISSKNIQKSALDFLISKIVNNSYEILSLDIKANSETEASLHMEIEL